jgi:hypothetical protein
VARRAGLPQRLANGSPRRCATASRGTGHGHGPDDGAQPPAARGRHRSRTISSSFAATADAVATRAGLTDGNGRSAGRAPVTSRRVDEAGLR